MALADLKKLKKKLDAIEKSLKGGYDDGIQDSKSEDDEVERRINQRVEREIASSSIGKQEQAYQDQVEIAEEMKDKIREISNMNTMGNVKLGLGEAWYQGQGFEDDYINCIHCGGKLPVKKIKKKLFKRKARRNAAKGKAVPQMPKFMRKSKGKPGPKKGGKQSTKSEEWIKYCRAVHKLPKYAGKPWNVVMKEASKLKAKGITISDLKAVE